MNSTRNWYQKKRYIFPLVAVTLFVILAAGAAAGGSSNSNSGTTQTNLSSNDTKTNTDAQPVAAKDKNYVEIAKFNGNGAKKTDSFNITGDKFKVKYTCNGSLCSAMAKKVGSDFDLDIVMNTTGDANDETVIYKKGERYIDVNSLGEWTMTVYDFK